METIQANYVNMIMDRLHHLEQENDQLKTTLEDLKSLMDARLPPVYLLPHTKFKDFNDGFTFCWELFSEPTMYDERTPKQEVFEDDFVPLDDIHWNAMIFPSGTFIKVGDYVDMQGREDRVFVGIAGKPVTVRMFVDEITEFCKPLIDQLQDDDSGYCGFYQGLAQHEHVCNTQDLVLKVSF